MKNFNFKKILLGLLGLAFAFLVLNVFVFKEEISYSQQVKPILNKHCISCHGGVKKQGKFSILFEEEAFQITASGKPSIIPFHADQSEFISRLTAKDPEERMPYKKPPLTKEEIEILIKWVDQGAKWENHWAYEPIKKPSIPSVSNFFSKLFNKTFDENPIDAFTLSKMKENGLEPSSQAVPEVLIRRLSLDLTGIPPTIELINRFKLDSSPANYEKIVDSLLASNSYGEKWASQWLDLARYSDSRGYQKDNGRTIWAYRDWVIKSFNENMSYKDFIIKQLAGDLLENPTKEDYIATGFHRNTMNNDETGTVDEEFRVAAILDRVNTTWDALHGTTFSCVQCHSHPYDPIKNEEYYKFMAFLNNTRDEDTIDEAPFYRTFSEVEEKQINEFIQSLKTQDSNQKDYIKKFIRFYEPRIYAHHADNFEKGALNGGVRIGLRDGGTCRLPSITTKFKKKWWINYGVSEPGGRLNIRLGSPDGRIIKTIFLNKKGYHFDLIDMPEFDEKVDFYLEALNPKLKGKRNDVINISWFALFPELDLNQNQWKKFEEIMKIKSINFPIYLEMQEDYKRKTFEFVRGNWLVHGKEVQPQVPSFMHNFKKQYPKNRLGLAYWITDPNNPLFARNIVNRFWEQLFGKGIVFTLEDLGSQGEKPTNQPLLDYLAYNFIHKYDFKPKDLIKEIVLSNTYKQSSHRTENAEKLDPNNNYLSYFPRTRLSSEIIRDQALAVSGLLNPKMFGKPIMPYQPEGVWQAVNSNLFWEKDTTDEQYRRAIYIFTRRTGPYPSQFTFDSPSREVCVVRRITTNTPLQALVLMNDPAFVEISNKIGEDMFNIPDSDLKTRISKTYKKLIFKDISPKKLIILENLYHKAENEFSKEEFNFKKEEVSLKSYQTIASALINLDEFLTKE
ncbi:MAG: hypothetical protein RIR51_1196 [Bacteroidota bacterium]